MSIELGSHFSATPYGTITDYKYSPNGHQLAIADSEGYVQIYSREAKSFKKVSEFRADQASIWGVSWANSKYGNLLGIGSFKNKVAIFQETGQGWKEIAYHELHTASVNWVEWAPSGLKLFAGSSDGTISILQVSQKQWIAHHFNVSESSIVSFALQPMPMGELISQDHQDSIYPRIATASKDQNIKIWAHRSQMNYIDRPHHLEEVSFNQSGYALVRQIDTPKETVRNLIWRPNWGSLTDAIKLMEIIYCTEEGNLKHLQITEQKIEGQKNLAIIGGQIPFTRVSQSLTGHLVSASTIIKDKLETVVLQEDEGSWKVVQRGPL